MAVSLEIDEWRHTSPVPNLIKLYLDQNTVDNEDLHKHQQSLEDLHKLILTEEKELLNAALDDDEMETLDQKGQLLMQSRLELIKQSVQGVKALKSALSESEFQKLLQIDLVNNEALLSNEALQLKHSNPMPNLVDYVLNNDTKPKLLDQQRERLQKWRSERSGVFALQSRSIVEMESQLIKMVQNQDSSDNINGLADNIAQLRVRIIRGKVFSRERLKQILENEQYQNLLGLYPSD